MDENVNLAGKIEKLIVDGQRDIAQWASVLQDGQKELAEGQKTIIELIKRLDGKVDKIDKKHDINAIALYDLLQDTNKNVKRVEDKLDEHMRQPAHA